MVALLLLHNISYIMYAIIYNIIYYIISYTRSTGRNVMEWQWRRQQQRQPVAFLPLDQGQKHIIFNREGKRERESDRERTERKRGEREREREREREEHTMK